MTLYIHRVHHSTRFRVAKGRREEHTATLQDAPTGTLFQLQVVESYVRFPWGRACEFCIAKVWSHDPCLLEHLCCSEHAADRRNGMLGSKRGEGDNVMGWLVVQRFAG